MSAFSSHPPYDSESSTNYLDADLSLLFLFTERLVRLEKVLSLYDK